MATVSTPERRHNPQEARTPSSSLNVSRSNNAMASPGRQTAVGTLSIEAALSNANGDLRLALEAVLNERNMLSSQNTQLWKLIEKQRSVHGSALKELERVRAERDKLLGKEAAAHKKSRSNSLQQGEPRESPSPDQPQTLNGRPPTTRHLSEDDGISRRQVPQLSTSRSYEPIRPPPPVSTSTDSLPKTNGVASPTDQSKPDSLSVPSPLVTSPTQPLQINKGTRSSPTNAPSPVVSLPPAEPRPDSPTQASSPSPETPEDTTLLVPTRNRAAARESRISLPDEARRFIVSMSESPIPSPSSRQTAFQTPSPDARSAEEPKEVMQPHSAVSGSPPNVEEDKDRTPGPSAFLEMDDDEEEEPDTPLEEDRDRPVQEVPQSLKPGTGTFAEQQARHVSHSSTQSPTANEGDLTPQPWKASSSQSTPHNAQQSVYSTPGPSVSSRDLSASVPEMMGTSTHAPSSSTSSSSELSRSPPTNTSTYGAGGSQAQTPTQTQSSTQAQVQAQRMAYAQAYGQVQSPPQPQAQAGYAMQQTPSQAQLYQQQYVQPPQAPYSNPSSTYPSTSTLAHPSQPTQPSQSQLQMQGQKRLLHPTDLQHTRILITGSHIRPNDRGKEVLSFVVQVSPPGPPSDAWKVEKLYSDVLGLDSRLRGSMSRSEAKRLGSLPDAKLFKDNAPAKVDLRKAALETYLQSVVRAPIKDPREVCEFFNTDITKDASAPVTQSGYKEGYLTKRGKNFGGWKTRYFVLQGPVLEYYESRGGTHLGSIQITGAQIGRQQKSGGSSSGDNDENEYRHAFLIIENKEKGKSSGGGSGSSSGNQRHVLCAESDQERDAWVDVLVRYVMGTYDDTGLPPAPPQPQQAQPRPSMSSIISTDSTVIGSSIGGSSMSMSTPSKRTKAEITKGMVAPINSLAQDPANAKFFSDSASSSPLDRYPPSLSDQRLQSINEDQISTSLPSSLDTGGGVLSQRAGAERDRSASALGYYGDVGGSPYKQQAAYNDPRTTPGRDKKASRRSMHPGMMANMSTANQSLTAPSSSMDRVPSPEPSPSDTNTATSSSKPQISGPMNGTKIPEGYKFGARDTSASDVGASGSERDRERERDRDRKTKSRNLGGIFGRIVGSSNNSSNSNDRASPVSGNNGVVRQTNRAVFGVPLTDALNVAMIAKLPAVVFRCIQYLEAKKAEQEEGIYRLSGSTNVIKSLKDRFNAEGDVDLLAEDEFWDPHAIAGLLKSFLRELPTSVLTRDLHLKFLGVIDLADPEDRINELAQLVERLPQANYVLLRALTAHLILIVQNSNTNKMTMRNVGIVFSPTLGIPAGVFSLMLGEFGRVFRDDAMGPGAGTNVQDNRNSKSYADGATDKLLGLAGRSLRSGDESDSGDENETLPDENASENDAEDPDATTTFTRSTGDLSSSHHGQHDEHNTLSPMSAHRGAKAANVAASRGLAVKVDHRKSMLPGPGLPHSPRPVGRQAPPSGSPPSTPN